MNTPITHGNSARSAANRPGSAALPPQMPSWSRGASRSIGRTRWLRRLAVTMCASLVVNALVALPASAAPKQQPRMPGSPAASTVPKPAPVRDTGVNRPTWPKPGQPVARPVVPPAAGTETVAVGTEFRRAGKLPVAVAAPGAGAGPATGAEAGHGAGTVATAVGVSTLDPSTVERIGGRSIGFQLHRTDGGDQPGQIAVRVDTSSIAEAYGGGFASRLRLARYPGCVLHAPNDAACATPTALESTADPVARTVTAVVDAQPALSATTAAAAAEAQPVYALMSLAASASAAGGNASDAGNFSATPLKASDGWVVGEQSGSFSYSYPLPAAPSTGGDTPALALSYDSGSVDGLTSHENNQSSPVGLGWDLAVPFIEHRMTQCTQSDLAGNLCWGGTNFVLSLGGHSSPLNYTSGGDGGDLYRMQDDQGWRIEQVYAGDANPNGDSGGVYWKVTMTDGTQYYFGRENSDWSADRNNSTLNVTMYAQNHDDVCWDSDSHHCDIAWRWNLAYVVDPVGNLQAYRYDKGRASYQSPGHNVKHYDAAGYLTSVSYGVTTANAKSTPAPQRIDLSYGWRCDFDGCRAPVPNDRYAANYPDVPFDLWCAEDAGSCSSPSGPVFFYLKKLNSVTATYYNGSGYTPVEKVSLEHGWPRYQDQAWSAVLWLRTITRTGYAADGRSESLPPVSFAGDYETWLPNRWDRSQAGTYQNKPRITDVFNEFGGRAHVTYGQPNPCDSQTLDGNEDKQTTDCFPSRESDGHQAWFRRYLVTRLEVIDKFGAPTQTTSYEYDTSNGAAWHSDNDPVTPKDQQSWSDYRGYAKVTVRDGTPGGQTTTEEHRYFRGMHGDRNRDGSTKDVSVRTSSSSDSTGHLTYRDDYYRKNLALEERTLRSDGSEVDATQHEYAANVLDRGPAGPFNLYLNGSVQVDENLTRQMQTAGGTVRKFKHVSHRTFDKTYGLEISEQDDGDPVSGTGPTCDYKTYARDTDKYIVDTEAVELSAAGVCPSDGSAPTANLIDRTETYYDANFTDLTATPTAGLATKVVKWASAAGAADPSTAISASKFDGYGRVVGVVAPDNFVAGATSFDRAGPATTTAYSAPNGPVVGVTVTGPAGHTSTQVMDPGLGQPVSTTDTNGRTTSLSYDAMGRMTSVRLPGDDFAAKTFSYTVSNTAPSVVVTAEYPAANATPVRSWQFHDSLGRVYQTQTTSPTGSIITKGTRFDDRGNGAAEVAVFEGPGTPGTPYGQWYDAAFAKTLPSQDVATYDDVDREVSSSLVSFGTIKRTTATSYDGTTKTTTPPSNSGASQVDTASTVVTEDLDDHVISRTQGAKTVGYTYDVAGDLVKITSPSGSVSTYTYDWLGRRVSTTDPNTGSTGTDYYPSGAVKHSRDAAGSDLFTQIDTMSRPVATYAGTSAGGALLARTEYDGTPLGAVQPLRGTVTSETNYVGSTAGAPGTPYTQAYGYDSRYHVTRTDQIVPAAVGATLAGTYSTTNTYDGMGRETSTTYPAAGGLSAETVTTTWDGAYPTKLTSPKATYVADTTFTGIGQMASRILGAAGGVGSVKRAYTWDPATSELLTQAAATPSTSATANLQSDSYLYSPTGDVTKITDGVAGQQQCFSYDELDRLSAAVTSTAGNAAGSSCTADSTGPTPYRESYSYDAEANLTALSHNGVTTTFGYGGNTTLGLTGGPHAPTTARSETGTATYSYDPTGQLTTKVANGVATNYTWDSQDHLTSINSGGSTARFAYGPDDDRWVRATASETVVYLAGQELHQATGANGATAVRYYAIADHTVAVRKTTDGGPAGGTLYWVLSDRQDSASVSVDAGTGTATRDRYLPYGGNRDGSNTWTMPTDRGWLGQVQDRDTGLDYLNARYYDPVLAHFISADPLNVQEDPQSANAFGYAAGNPIGFYDPTGLWPSFVDNAINKVSSAVSSAASWVNDHKDVVADVAVGIGVGIGAAALCSTGVGCAIVVGAIAGAAGGAAGYGVRVAEHKENFSVGGLVKSAAGGAASGALGGAVGYGAAKAGAVLLKQVVKPAARNAAAGFKVAGQRAVKATPAGVRKAATKVAGATKAAVNKVKGGCSNSFTGDTPVLMADGSSKPIADVAIGDQVVATDPTTATTAVEPVVNLIRHSGPHQMVTVTLSDATSITATDGHPFWDATTSTWVEAKDLVVGDKVRLVGGAVLAVTALVGFSEDLTAYNLTVDDLHTYYAGQRPVLVHNASCSVLDAKRAHVPKGPGLYVIHLKNGKTYVGISKNMYKRIGQHVNRSKGALKRENYGVHDIDRIEFRQPSGGVTGRQRLERRVIKMYGGPTRGKGRLLNRASGHKKA